MTDQEILSLVGQRVGHAALRHMEWHLVEQGFIAFVVLGIMRSFARSALVSEAFSVTTPALHLGVFAFEYIISPFLLASIRVWSNAVARGQEYEADAFLATMSDAYTTGLQTALIKLSADGNQDPKTPWFYEMLYDQHPSLTRRWAALEAIRLQHSSDIGESK